MTIQTPHLLPDPPAFAALDGLDCETAALHRAWLRRLFDEARNWTALSLALRHRGLGLGIRDGRLYLTRNTDGRRVAPVRFLGTNLAELSQRLGRPVFRPRRDRPAAGDLIR
ncbi:hypothetical protein ACFORG_15540 [Lutimaribacter marinistellae]|uniref:Uncharacterized protein n=1 Tax=Lutimaribacter marinistellae TaxID=1820329 RepID=A0ABV7TL71_9RHOB